MLKIIKTTTHIFICILVIFGINACYAKNIPISLKCSPTFESAPWKPIPLKVESNMRLSITPIGIEIAKEGGEKELVTMWDDFAHNVYHTPIYNSGAHIRAECTSPIDGATTKGEDIYDSMHIRTLVCEKGEGMKLRFINPNSEDPNKFIARLQLTVDRDDPPAPPANQIENVMMPGIGMMDPARLMGMGGMLSAMPASVSPAR